MMQQEKADENLWIVLMRLQGCVFFTVKKLWFKYTIKGGKMFVDRKKDSITKVTVFMTFHKALELQGEGTGPKKLGTFGLGIYIRFSSGSGLLSQMRCNRWGSMAYQEFVNEIVFDKRIIKNTAKRN